MKGRREEERECGERRRIRNVWIKREGRRRKRYGQREITKRRERIKKEGGEGKRKRGINKEE